jgi:hypothetical protein
MGVLVASSFAAAQPAPATTTVGGEVTVGALGTSDVTSSKFYEYRALPNGANLPFLNLFAWKGDNGFTFDAQNVRQTDQRYSGRASVNWFGVAFDFNSIPHNMGFDGLAIHTETAPGVWSMSSTLRQSLGATADAKLPTSARTYDFYASLLAPTFAAAGPVDVTSLRERGTLDVLLSQGLPFDLSLTYMRERKSGSRTLGGADILGAVSPVIETPEPLNDLTQDFGFRFGWAFKMGDVHASLNRNVYDNRAETLFIDNPFQPFDVAYKAAAGQAPALGGPGRAMVINAPDNEATRGAFGVKLKFPLQTRILADVALNSWTQNAAFHPYTSNSTVLTGAGVPANLASSLQEPSLNGKINTTMVNVSFMSRPLPGLGIRARYRSYDLANKTNRWVINGDLSASPDRSWSTVSAAPDAPYGHVTANPYDTNSKRFEAIATYDIKALTLEGSFRTTDLSRTWREAETGRDTGYGFAAVFRASDLVNFRAFVDDAHRTAEGHTVYGFQADEAERDMLRTGVDVVLMPSDKFDVTFTYLRRDVDYPDRPDRIAVSSGVPVAGAQPIPGTPSGLLEAKYDSFTGEVGFRPNARAELGAFYTYEKDANTVQWHTTSGVNLNNSLRYAGSDKGNTFGANALFHIVPDQWVFSAFASYQKVDGLMDITAREAGAFYTPGRTTVIPAGTGGAADIADWDDTMLTTVGLQLDRRFAKAWKLAFGYWYEKYEFKDAFTSGTALMPQSILIFMRPDNGDYTANVGYATLSFRF